MTAGQPGFDAELVVQYWLTEAAFNIESRYPDLKRSFRAKCTPEFTARQMEMIKEIFTWQRSLIT